MVTLASRVRKRIVPGRDQFCPRCGAVIEWPRDNALVCQACGWERHEGRALGVREFGRASGRGWWGIAPARGAMLGALWVVDFLVLAVPILALAGMGCSLAGVCVYLAAYLILSFNFFRIVDRWAINAVGGPLRWMIIALVPVIVLLLPAMLVCYTIHCTWNEFRI